MSNHTPPAGAGAARGRLEGVLRDHSPVWVLAGAALAAVLAWNATSDYSLSDPWGNLLTAQAILEQGTVRLDAYADAEVRTGLRLGAWRDGHLYYEFPLGTPVLALPAVWLANLRGLDMAVVEDNRAVQKQLAAASVAAAFLLFFALARAFLPHLESYLVTASFVFGTSVMSSVGTALWSLDFALLLGLGALHLVVRAERESRDPPPWTLAALLSAAYICRPTAAIPILVVTAWVAVRRRAVLLKLAAGMAMFLLPLVVFSWLELGQIVPDYYRPLASGGPRGAREDRPKAPRCEPAPDRPAAR